MRREADTGRRRDTLKVMLLWGRWGPYHAARLAGLRARAPGLQVLPVQYSAGSQDYGWMQEADAPGLVTLRNRRDEALFSPWVLVSQLFPLMLREQPDVVFVPAYWHWSLATTLFARSLGARVVMMNESHGGTVNRSWPKRMLRRAVMRLFDAALVGGEPQRRYFSGLGIPEDAVFTGYDAVDNAFFAANAHHARQTDQRRHALGLPERYILWAGRMEPKKDLPTLLHAYARLLGRNPGAEALPTLLLVGGGSDEQQVEHICRELGLQLYGPQDEVRGPGVQRKPFLSPANLAAAYALAECFVLSSKAEEWGLVVNEAMACGCPVVVSDAAGCAEDLLRGPDDEGFPRHRVRRGGLLFGAGNAAELADTLELLHQDAELRARLGREASAAIAAFSPRRFGDAACMAALRAIS